MNSKTGKILTAGLALALVLALVMLGIKASEAARFRDAAEKSYLRALEELGDHLTVMERAIDKCRYAGTALQVTGQTARIWRAAGGAKSAVSLLPVGDTDLSAVNKFISQAGEFSLALSRKSAAGEKISKEEADTLEALSGYAAELSGHIGTLCDSARENGFPADAFLQKGREEPPEGSIAAGFIEAENGFTGFPTLIYDGPFSDHLLEKDAEMTKGKRPVSVKQGRRIAAMTAMLPIDQLNEGEEDAGRLPSYVYHGENAVSAVTKAGGYPLYMRKFRVPDKPTASEGLTVKSALRAAENYLSELGIRAVSPTYHEITDNLCVFNFAALTDGVLCYTDLIKVGVALDNGEILLYDGQGYLVNHHAREFTEPLLSEKEASERVSDALHIESCRRVLIPSEGLLEKYCYEFTCRGKYGETVLVYIGCDTGYEEQILELILSENGALTM